VLRWILRTRPITDAGLLPKFEEMGQITCPGNPPRFEYVDMRGGAVANAVALPSLRGSGALFSSTLLALLDRDEIIAICAHELAHLEYYSPAWLRRARLVDFGLIALACASTALSRVLLPSVALYGELPVLALMLTTLLWRAKDRQKNETASDLRAVALGGNAEALACGLTKLYSFARIPRRWDAQREKAATHPSLARRIRDIRAANGIAPAPVGPGATFGVSERTGVTFNDTLVEWRECEGVTHSLSYAHLSELRVHAGTSGPARLVAVEKTGRRWEMPLRREEVASVQAVLDSVDGQLASVPTPRISTSITSIVKFICVAVMLSMTQVTCALITLFSLWRPSSNMLTGAAVASIVSGLLSIRQWDSVAQYYPIGPVMAGVMAVVGGGLLLLARTTRRDETSPPPMRPIVSLAIVAALLVVFLGAEGLNPVRLHQNAADFPAATIVLSALAGALISDRRRQVRLAGIAPAVLAGAVTAAGSLTFLDYVARDPFLVATGSAVVRTFEGSPSSEMKVAFDVAALRLSPGGRAVAAQEDNEDRDEPYAKGAFHIGRAGDTLRKIPADEVAFVNDDHALALTFADGAAEIRELTVADPDTAIWRTRIPDVASASMLVSPGGDWHLVGWTRQRAMVSATGRVGQDSITRVEWPPFDVTYSWGQAMTAAGQKALFLDTAYQGTPFQNPLLIGLYAGARSHTESRLWHLVQGERHMTAVSRLDVSCSTGALTNDGLICAAFDGARTRIVSIDTATAEVHPVTMFWGRFRASADGAAGWITGWLDISPIALRLATNEALRISQPPREWIRAVAATDGAIGTVSSGVGGARIRVYPLDYRSASR
jgi:hypothetical protein